MRSIVKKFDGTNWVPVGAIGFSSDIVQSTNLAFGPFQVPYVSFVDGSSLSVMKYPFSSGISEISTLALTVFPNPCLNKLNVEMIENGLSKSKFLEIVNLAGETLAQLQTEAINIQIDVSTYPAGIYLIKIRNENSVWSGKFCKM